MHCCLAGRDRFAADSSTPSIVRFEAGRACRPMVACPYETKQSSSVDVFHNGSSISSLLLAVLLMHTTSIVFPLMMEPSTIQSWRFSLFLHRFRIGPSSFNISSIYGLKFGFTGYWSISRLTVSSSSHQIQSLEIVPLSFQISRAMPICSECACFHWFKRV